MFKKSLRIGAIALVGVLVIGAVAMLVLPERAEAAYGGGQGAGHGPAVADPVRAAPMVDQGATDDLSGSEAEALAMALDDEYKAWAVYDQVIADLGAVPPFTRILQAEDAHITALVTLFNRYRLEVPANPWPGNVPTFDTLAEACAGGVQAEIDNAALYDELFTMVDNPDIVRMFTSLRQASLTKHMPAFERCAR